MRLVNSGLQFLNLLSVEINQPIGLAARRLHFAQLSLHRGQLAVVNAKGYDSDNGESAVDDKLRELNPSKFSRKLFGCILLAIGSLVGIGANFALGWSDWRTLALRWRLSLWIAGWFLAVSIICHATNLLIGIN